MRRGQGVSVQSALCLPSLARVRCLINVALAHLGRSPVVRLGRGPWQSLWLDLVGLSAAADELGLWR